MEGRGPQQSVSDGCGAEDGVVRRCVVAAVEVNDLAVLDDTLVAVGAYRTAADPGIGGFQGRVWTSTDAASFTQIDLGGVRPSHGYRADSYAGHLAVTGDRLLVAGRIGGSAAVWTSDDGARTWQQVADPALDNVYDISGLAAVGDVVLAGVGNGSVTALRSTDRGSQWARGRSRPTRPNGTARTFTQVRLTFRRERAIPNDSQSGCSLFELYYDI